MGLKSETTDLLERAIQEFHWMARRYCDGRMSTAPGSFNSLTRELIDAGIALRAPCFARDGMGRAYDGLTDEEAIAAQGDMPRGHAMLETEWMARTERLRTLLAEARNSRAADIVPDGWTDRVDAVLKEQPHA